MLIRAFCQTTSPDICWFTSFVKLSHVPDFDLYLLSIHFTCRMLIHSFCKVISHVVCWFTSVKPFYVLDVDWRVLSATTSEISQIFMCHALMLFFFWQITIFGSRIIFLLVKEIHVSNIGSLFGQATIFKLLKSLIVIHVSYSFSF